MDQAALGALYFAGIDPSGTPFNPSGLCIVDDNLHVRVLKKWFREEDFVNTLESFASSVAAIGLDGPLKPPHELKMCCFKTIQNAATIRQPDTKAENANPS